MKTKWKKRVVFPLLTFMLSLSFLQPAMASLWNTESISVCNVQVQIADRDGSWTWVTVSGIEKDCTPEAFSSCAWSSCAPIPYVER